MLVVLDVWSVFLLLTRTVISLCQYNLGYLLLIQLFFIHSNNAVILCLPRLPKKFHIDQRPIISPASDTRYVMPAYGICDAVSQWNFETIQLT